jgi:hypothetical protein
MTVASAAAQTAARSLAALVILGAVSCEPAAARHRPRPRPPGTFCAAVIAEHVGLRRICGIPAAARR